MFNEPSTRPETLSEWASYYVGQGLPLFPIWPRKKNPVPDHGYKEWTRDAESVKEYWDKNPTCNIGMPTGSVSGIVVIDIDVDEERDEDGQRTLYAWEKEHGELAETLTAITGRGGMHMFYHVSMESIDSTADNTEDKRVGIDIRGDGGYVVLPPSIHPNGNGYEWQDWPWDVEIADADDNVIEFIKHVQKISKRDTTKTDAKGRVSFEMPEVISEGGRHDTLKRYAASLRGKGYEDDIISSCLKQTNADRCRPPLQDDEVQGIIDYYCKMGPGHNGEGQYFGDSHDLAAAAKLSDAKLNYYDINDKTLGRVFANTYGNLVRYVPEWKSFVAYNGKHWQVNGGTQIAEKLIKHFVTQVQIYAATKILNDDDRTKAIKRAANYNKQTYRAHLLKDIQSEVTTTAEAFDTNSHLLNVQNCTIDFDQKRCRPHDPKDLITQIAPVTFDKDASCDLFVSALRTAVQGDVETERYVQKLSGLVVSGETKYDYLATVGTEKRSGKGTVFGALLAMLGTGTNGYGVSVNPETFAKRRSVDGSAPSPDRAKLKGRRLILTSEFEGDIQLDCQFVKRLTGGDEIQARYLKRNPETFGLAGIIVMLFNAYPTVDDHTLFDSGRVATIPFDHFIPENERDYDLRNKLKEPEQLSGLLNWAIEGYKLLVAEGFNRPDAVLDKTEEFTQTADDVGRFVYERVEHDENAYMTARDLFEAFKSWGGNLTDKSFYSRLRQFFTIEKRATRDGKRLRGVIDGIRLAA